MKITKDTTLAKIIGDEKIREVLVKYRLPCLTCPFAEREMENLKIGEICKMYGINLKSLLGDINGVYKN